MKIGSLVTFKYLPTPNTPGAPSSELPGVGTVVNDEYLPGKVGYGLWCDVLWPSGELTKCFKKDMTVLKESK
tara:strand:+ start:74 stop:289 length:216 start_codon:yes stop_codon:yes gene_type:complete